VQCVIGISLHFINEDIVLNIPAEKRWILEVYDIEAAFLNANPGGHMYIKILDEMVKLGFMTKKNQELIAILLDQNIYGNIDAVLRWNSHYGSGIYTKSDRRPMHFLQTQQSQETEYDHITLCMSMIF